MLHCMRPEFTQDLVQCIRAFDSFLSDHSKFEYNRTIFCFILMQF